jgi:hypothetical protein
VGCSYGLCYRSGIFLKAWKDLIELCIFSCVLDSNKTETTMLAIMEQDVQCNIHRQSIISNNNDHTVTFLRWSSIWLSNNSYMRMWVFSIKLYSSLYFRSSNNISLSSNLRQKDVLFTIAATLNMRTRLQERTTKIRC